MTEHDADILTDEQGQATGLVLADQQLPQQVYLLPVHNRPFFPAQIMPIMVPTDPWEETLKRVGNTSHRMLALFMVDDELDTDTPLPPEQLPRTGCLVKIHQAKKNDDHIQFIAEGISRVQLRNLVRTTPPYLIDSRYPQPQEDNDNEVKAYAMALINAIKELLPTNPLYSEELKQYLNRFSPNEPSHLADFAAFLTTAGGEALQAVLDEVELLPRMEKVLALLKKELDVARLHGEISKEVNRKISQREREFFLRQQLKVIQQELGIAKDDKTADIDQFRARLKGKTLNEEAQQRIDDELQKLSVLEQGSPEYAVTRNYLDWATQLPWGVHGKDKLKLDDARKVLDRHHSGLDDVKQRILEFLAVGAFKGDISGAIMLLVGPPGVGKTSIGKSIAESLGRPFYRFSVGGMRDEAEIKGHRRTYIGAMPGKFVQALKDTKVMNPVIMLDEIDKMGASYQGDPASALLETLDPEQNANFLDHYLDLRLDLSKCLFICTANTLDSIPGPLLDRMDIIRLSGYLADEKVAIAKKHLLPRQLEKAGVKRDQLRLTGAAIKQIIEGYAREAGVRNLEKQLAKIVRKAVVKLLDKPQQTVRITPKELPEYLGQPLFRDEQSLSGTGIITGLAWTSMGGATLPVEANVIHQQSRGLKLTGQLGEVMRESAEIAYSYISSELARFGAPAEFYDKALVHLHVPEGATPKDGPSAGVTMASALLSLALGKVPKKGLAMTGELTLTGRVLPVGGIREKVIAAKRQKIHELILPQANRGDYEELPEYVRDGMTIHFARQFKDVAKVLF